ncbi:pyridoxal-phosphate dependent enzyme [Streptomyces humi]|uniref:pyridoxal-phosphate dependent enzyme n=1 Tax=Streptomyces humi TaxID=1428620 RepID=UPI0006286E1B|nr:pyridoxal-phosphate dependent enzyme [Streptomyces humi]
MFDHIADALAQPDLIRLRPGLFTLRFESMKVISALGAVEQLMADGVIRPGDTLVDSSSGVYAHALALACQKYGFHCHIVASPIVDAALRAQLQVLGATVDQPDATDNAKLDQAGRVRKVIEYVGRHPGTHWMRQYHDRIHYRGYEHAAKSMMKQLDVPELVLVGGVGSGASTGGLATALRRHGVDARLLGIQPFGSVSFASQDVEDPEFLIAGLGSGIHFGNIDYDAYDDIHWIDFTYARSGSIELLREHGVFAGLSSGAAYAVAEWQASRHGFDDGRPVVFVTPDTGHRYVHTVFEDPDSAVVRDSDRYPLVVTEPVELRLPWCRTDWKRHGVNFAKPKSEF